MARETRTSTRDTAASGASSTPNKRKRSSRSPIPPTTTPSTSIKLVLPSPSALAAKAEADSTEEEGATAKRQKITVKVKPVNGHRDVGGQSDGVIVNGNAEEDADELKQEEPKSGVLGPDLRGALASVIARMAVHLPTPLNGILTLWLPPTFAQKEENTLGWVLRQSDLTWEALVDLLHLFAENLLVPCSYPNPMPALSQFHQPVPPLPSHFRPHVIYNFCASLYALMLQIEPGERPSLDAKTAERWTLVQKIPASLSSNTSAGEWFTSAVDPRVTEAAVKKEGGDTLLEEYAARGDKFGVAQAVSLQSMGAQEPRVVKLGDSVIRRASLKAARWKELRAARGGGFGSIARGVQSVSLGETTWTPTFAPTYDSSKSTGGSYYTQVAAMAEKSRFNEYKRLAGVLPEYTGWSGTTGEKVIRTTEDVLRENAGLIEALQTWQEDRVKREDVAPSVREQAIADALFASLSDLASGVQPGDLISSTPGLAHELSQRFIPVSMPSIRGTLDPRRPKAIHDNLTVKPKPIGQAVPAVKPYQSSATPVKSYTYTPRPTTPAYRPPTPAYTPYSPNGSFRPNHTPTSQPVRPGPGPSALRQSFGPTAGNGSPYGRNPAAGLMSQIGTGYR